MAGAAQEHISSVCERPCQDLSHGKHGKRMCVAPRYFNAITMHVDDAPVRMWGAPGQLQGDACTDRSVINARDAQGRRAGWAVVTLTDQGVPHQARWGVVPYQVRLITFMEVEAMRFALDLEYMMWKEQLEDHVPPQRTAMALR
eukprot:5299980-Amphidinium_carterae.2